MGDEAPKQTRVRVRSPDNARRLPKRKAGEPPRPWNPEHAARLPFYPKTPEEHAARYAAAAERLRRQTEEGRMGRLGVPDGWAGRGAELAVLRETARVEAKGIVRHLLATGAVDASEDPRAEEALEAVVAIVRARDPATGQYLYASRDRLDAARVVLTYTRQRPAVRTDVSDVQSAEAVLAALVASAGRDD